MDAKELFGEPIHSYTRAQAIEDGELVDLTAWAKETGFKVPVAITRAAWAEFIDWPQGLRPELGQSERGRAHDVLWMMYLAGRRAKPGQIRVDFRVARVLADDQRNGMHPTEGALYALSHPGDHHEHVLTIMLLGED